MWHPACPPNCVKYWTQDRGSVEIGEIRYLKWPQVQGVAIDRVQFCHRKPFCPYNPEATHVTQGDKNEYRTVDTELAEQLNTAIYALDQCSLKCYDWYRIVGGAVSSSAPAIIR